MQKKSKIFITLVLVLILVVIVGIKVSSIINEDINVVSDVEENTKYSEYKNNFVEESKANFKNDENQSTQEEIEPTNKDTLVIQVVGAVKNPGVIEVEDGKRLIDAVSKAGGLTDEADNERNNLAIRVEDGVSYKILKIDEEEDIIQSSSQSLNLDIGKESSKDSNRLVNINTADISELTTLSGIGEATASKIINYIDENGLFKSIEEIKNVSGIGNKKYEAIKDMICVK